MTDAEREVRAAMERATPGAWKLRDVDFAGRRGGWFDVIGHDERGELVICSRSAWPKYAETSNANGALIVAMHEALPALLGEISRLRGVEAAARELSEARKESVRLTETVAVGDFDAGFVKHADCLRRTVAAFNALDAALARRTG